MDNEIRSEQPDENPSSPAASYDSDQADLALPVTESSASAESKFLTQSVSHIWNAAPDFAASPFAGLLLSTAVRLVDLPSAAFDEVLTESLEMLAAHLNMEHVGLSLLEEGSSRLSVLQRYVVGDKTLPSVDTLDTPFPWYTSQLRHDKIIVLPNGADDLPPEAVAERAYALKHGFKSSLILPLWIGGKLVGSLYFNSTTHAYEWPVADRQALTIFGRVLAGAVQRRLVDEVMHRNEEQLTLAIDAAGIGIWSWDIEHPERSYGSDNLSKIHGISPCPKEQALQIYLDSLDADDRRNMEQLLERCLSGEVDDFTVENCLTWPDDSLHWVEIRGYVLRAENGRPRRITGVLQEITRRKEAEVQVEQQRLELLRHTRIMAQTERLGEIGGWEWDITNDTYFWTPETYRILGVSPDDFVLDIRNSFSFFTPASATILRSALQRAQDFGESFDHKIQAITAQGKTIWIRIVGRFEITESQSKRLYGSMQDITLRTQIEDQLREAQKMEAIGQLAGGIAHDFNNLLTSINGMSELAMRYLEKTPSTPEVDRVRNYLGEIHRAGGRAAELTRQLLAFSRKQVLRPKVLDLRVEVMKAQDLLQQILGENIELILRMPSHLGLVMADPSQIDQVITHLIINARDAMPTGGTLTIRLFNFAADRQVANQITNNLLPGDYIVLEVQDSGLGMTPEVRSRLFNPFFTTKPVGAGTGLGLSTVYGIVKQSGGMIEVESEPAVGSTFRIFLPQSAASPPTSKAPALSVRGGTETILLVGDDAWARQGYRVLLETKGYHLLEAATGRAAINLSQSYIGPIHLLVVSVLNDMSEIALANQTKLTRTETRILFLSSTRDFASPVNHAESGYAFLHKPFTPDVLTAKVRSVLDATTSHPLHSASS